MMLSGRLLSGDASWAGDPYAERRAKEELAGESRTERRLHPPLEGATSLANSHDEASSAHQCDVVGHRRGRDVDAVGELADAESAATEGGQHAQPGRVGHGGGQGDEIEVGHTDRYR
jgi:hypothetical protein